MRNKLISFKKYREAIGRKEYAEALTIFKGIINGTNLSEIELLLYHYECYKPKGKFINDAIYNLLINKYHQTEHTFIQAFCLSAMIHNKKGLSFLKQEFFITPSFGWDIIYAFIKNAKNKELEEIITNEQTTHYWLSNILDAIIIHSRFNQTNSIDLLEIYRTNIKIPVLQVRAKQYQKNILKHADKLIKITIPIEGSEMTHAEYLGLTSVITLEDRNYLEKYIL